MKQYRFNLKVMLILTLTLMSSALVVAKALYSEPGQPKITGIMNIKANGATLYFEKPMSDGGRPIINYKIDCYRSFWSGWIKIGETESPETSYRFTCMNEGDEAEFRVSAANSVGFGKPSAPFGPVLFTK